MADGAFCLVLHSHIPYVLGHGQWPHGHHMICEAAADSYLPLLWEFRALIRDGISPNVTFGITPTVMEQLSDERFHHWFLDYLGFRVNTATWDQEEWQRLGEGHLQHLAWRWQEHFTAMRRFYEEDLKGDILGAFRELDEQGHIEVTGSAATHGYFPLLREDTSILAQIRQGVATFQRFMGRRPRGFWLPECAYRPRSEWGEAPAIRGGSDLVFRPGVEELLANHGIEFFFVDNHMLNRGDHALPVDVSAGSGQPGGRLFERIRRRPIDNEGRWPKSAHSAYFVGDAFEDHPPVVALFRDEEVCRHVWSADLGYPGDPDYLEFHKRRFPGRHRYWRVTSRGADLGHKWAYEPEWADNKVPQHAGHFLSIIKGTLAAQSREFRLPVLMASFDTELFGHWWYEGARFIGYLLRYANQDPSVEVKTVRDYLREHPPTSAVTLPEGSWGAGGGHSVWLNEDTHWVWQRIYDVEQDMRALAREWGDTQDEHLLKLLAQAGREALLLQASDLPFLISTGGAVEAAQWRINAHYTDFKAVAELARRYGRHETLSESDWAYFGELAQRNRLFPDHHPSMWRE